MNILCDNFDNLNIEVIDKETKKKIHDDFKIIISNFIKNNDNNFVIENNYFFSEKEMRLIKNYLDNKGYQDFIKLANNYSRFYMTIININDIQSLYDYYCEFYNF